MKKCPGCGYLWADEYAGQCVECGKPLSGVSADQNLQFRYAGQLAAGRRETSMELEMKASRGRARPGDVYDRAQMRPEIVERAREMLIQKEEIVYEESD